MPRPDGGGWAAMSSHLFWRPTGKPRRGRGAGEAVAPHANVKVAVSASVGIAVYPQSGTTVLQLLERADVTLCQAKGLGKRPGRTPTCERSGGRPAGAVSG